MAGYGLVVADIVTAKAGLIVAILGTAAVLAMGWARVYLGAHHVLDVVAGIAMGVGSVLVAAKAFALASGYPDRSTPGASPCSVDHVAAPDAEPDDHGVPAGSYRGRHLARAVATSA